MLKTFFKKIAVADNEKGFTFIELVVTGAVTFVVVIGFIGAATALQNATTAAFERTIAMQDAHQTIEAIRDASVTGTFPDNVVAAYPHSGTVSGFSSLTNEVVTVTYANVAADPLDMTVTVAYKENGTRDVSISLRTLMTQRT